MIDWATVSPALKRLFSSLALDESPAASFCAEWFDGKRSHINTEVRKELTLRVTNVASAGEDERRYTQETVDGDVVLTESMVGLRKFTLQVRVDSYDHDPDCDNWCWSMTERIRTRLRRSSSVATLEAACLSLLDVGPSIDASFVFDQHAVNAALFDCTFYAAFTDSDPVPQGWIEYAVLTSQITDVDASTVPSPPNYTGESVPSLA